MLDIYLSTSRCYSPMTKRIISLQFNCCGIYGYGDYNGTAWWRDAQISGNRRQVPLTCCVLKNIEVRRADLFSESFKVAIYMLMKEHALASNFRMLINATLRQTYTYFYWYAAWSYVSNWHVVTNMLITQFTH